VFRLCGPASRLRQIVRFHTSLHIVSFLAILTQTLPEGKGKPLTKPDVECQCAFTDWECWVVAKHLTGLNLCVAGVPTNWAQSARFAMKRWFVWRLPTFASR
jgi:hypothetical protein